MAISPHQPGLAPANQTSTPLLLLLKQNAGKILGFLILTIGGVIALIPMYWMFANAFMPDTLVLHVPPAWYPKEPTIANFQHLFRFMPAFRWITNSVVVVGTITLISVFINPLTGYALAKLRFPGRQLIFWLIVSSFMIPSQLVVIYLYVMAYRLGWIDTYQGLIIPSLGSAFGIFLMKQYMQTLPSSLIDAARMDACTEFGIFWRIVMPLAKPGIAVLAIFMFMQNWNEFFWPLVATTKVEMRTLQVGLSIYRYQFEARFASQMAGAVIAAIPMIIVFLGLQRYFMKGLTIGAIKG